MANDASAHFGMAGHLAAMSEFLLRGYNVALPFVDRGDDILTIEDERGFVRRVQVKTRVLESCRRDPCVGCRICQGDLWTIHPQISRKQLQHDGASPLYYMFMLRPDAGWRFVLTSQLTLRRLFDEAMLARPGIKDHEAARSDGLVVPIDIDGRTSTAQIWGQEVAYGDPWREWPPTRFATRTTASPSAR